MIRRRRQGWSTRYQLTPLGQRVLLVATISLGLVVGWVTGPFGMVPK